MKTIFRILIPTFALSLLATAAPMGILPVGIQSQQLRVIDPATYERESVERWGKITERGEHFDYASLDKFLEEFPDAECSADVFAARLGLVQASGSIKDYNEFINKYPERLSTSMAVHELFELYDRVGTMSAYLDFLKRYPRTPQASLARQKVYLIAYELAIQRDQLEDYDAFIRLFPEAVQIVQIKDWAGKRRMAQEDEILRSPAMDARPEKGARANVLAVEFGKAMTDAGKARDAAEQGLLLHRASRIMDVLTERYAEYDAAREVRNEARHGELVKKLDELDETLRKNHAELLDELHKEFAETRKSIADGVAALKLDNAETRKLLDERFRNLENKADILHKDLGGIQDELIKINAKFTDLQQGIAATNRKLDQVRDDLDNLHQGLAAISTAIGSGLQQNRMVLESVRFDIQSQTKNLAALSSGTVQSKANNLNCQLSEKNGTFEKRVRINRGGFTPVKMFLASAKEVGNTFLESGGDEARRAALDAVPGILSEAVGWSVENIPIAGEFLAAPAAELAYNLGQETIRSASNLKPEEIAMMAGKAESMVAGSGPVVNAALAAISLDADSRKRDLTRNMGNRIPEELIGLIARIF